MRYLTIFTSAEREAPPSADEQARMGQLIEEMASAGVLLAAEGCMPSALGARVRLADGKVTVTDGPFAEAKEVVGGFAILQVGSKDEAIEWTKRFVAVAGDGLAEIRQLYETPAYEGPAAGI